MSIYHSSKFEIEIQYFSVGKYDCLTENQKILDWCNSRLFGNLSIKIPTGYIVQVINTGILWDTSVNITKDNSNFADALKGLNNVDYLEFIKF